MPLRDEDFGDEALLLDRLLSTKKEVVFLLGAPVCSPAIRGVGGVVDLIKAALTGTVGHDRLVVALSTSTKPYQDAFRILIQVRGQDEANAIIRQAVLEARNDPGSVLYQAVLRPKPAAADFEALERDLAGWRLTPGVEALGRVISLRPDLFGRKLLTTNFDPLVEVAIATAGGLYCKVFLHSDGALGQIGTNACVVVHLHGDWYSSDTLHTPTQLLQPRPNLKASLRGILESCTLVVLAYGGWDDVFTGALAEVVQDNGANFDVLWAFHESDLARLRSKNATLLAQLEPGFGRSRVVPYRGINAHTLLEALASGIASATTTAITPPSAGALAAALVATSPSGAAPPSGGTAPSGAGAPTAGAGVPSASGGSSMSPERELATRFLALSFLDRTRIVEQLGLVDAGEKPATDPDFFRRCFTRARDRGKLGELWAKVAAHHAGQMDHNPFTSR